MNKFAMILLATGLASGTALAKDGQTGSRNGNSNQAGGENSTQQMAPNSMGSSDINGSSTDAMHGSNTDAMPGSSTDSMHSSNNDAMHGSAPHKTTPHSKHHHHHHPHTKSGHNTPICEGAGCQDNNSGTNGSNTTAN